MGLSSLTGQPWRNAFHGGLLQTTQRNGDQHVDPLSSAKQIMKHCQISFRNGPSASKGMSVNYPFCLEEQIQCHLGLIADCTCTEAFSIRSQWTRRKHRDIPCDKRKPTRSVEDPVSNTLADHGNVLEVDVDACDSASVARFDSNHPVSQCSSQYSFSSARASVRCSRLVDPLIKLPENVRHVQTDMSLASSSPWTPSPPSDTA